MPLLKLQLKKTNEHNHKRALGAREGVQNEDSTWEYKKNSAYKLGISRGQEILSGEDFSCPQLNNFQIRVFANNVSPTY